MRPCFSVVVPVYNVGLFLERCIDSLINQKYDNVEFILVDDGSTDSSPRICDDYAAKDKRIKVLHKENGGVVSARQAGCRESTGEYILNVDGDDWVTADYFEHLNEIVQKYDPDYICFNNYRVENENYSPCRPNLPTGFYNREKIEKTIFPMLIERADGQYFSPSLCFKAIKRSIYCDCLLAVDTGISLGDDNACAKPALFKSNNVYISEKCIYCYRMNPQSMTHVKEAFSWYGPELIGKNFEKQIDMSVCDFQEQVYRVTVHFVFNAAESQFNRKAKYRLIRQEILEKLQTPYYKNAIRSCYYKNGKNKLVLLMLKNNHVFAIFLCHHARLFQRALKVRLNKFLPHRRIN